MKVHIDCIPCLLRQALDATKLSSNASNVRENALREVMKYLLGQKWDKTTPELATNVHRLIKNITGNNDPYCQLKRKYTDIALILYPKIVNTAKSSNNQLLSAVKIAIAGNMIDFGPKTEINLENDIEKIINSELAINDLDKLETLIQRGKRALYLADNAGETVFDRILVDYLLEQGVKVTYAVKSAPILNDATFQDAKEAGISKNAHIMSIGTDCTGIIFNECSQIFLNEFETSDFIISKGQGNYESLNNTKTKNVFFLLKVKCPLIAEDIDAKLGSAVLKKAK